MLKSKYLDFSLFPDRSKEPAEPKDGLEKLYNNGIDRRNKMVL